MKRVILNLVCNYCGITQDQFFEPRGLSEIVRARRMYFNLCKDLLSNDVSHGEICESMGLSRYYHKTYSYTHQGNMDVDKTYRDHYSLLRSMVEEQLPDAFRASVLNDHPQRSVRRPQPYSGCLELINNKW